MPTLVILPDFAAIHRAPRTTADKWRAKGWLGEAAAHASDTDIWVYEAARETLAAHLARPASPRGRIPTPREPDAAFLAETRTRATVEPGVIVAGIAEIAYCLWADRKHFQESVRGRAARGRTMPAPIAILGPPVKPDGAAARQVTVWDLRAFVVWPEFDKRPTGRGAEVAERNRVC